MQIERFDRITALDEIVGPQACMHSRCPGAGVGRSHGAWRPRAPTRWSRRSIRWAGSCGRSSAARVGTPRKWRHGARGSRREQQMVPIELRTFKGVDLDDPIWRRSRPVKDFEPCTRRVDWRIMDRPDLAGKSETGPAGRRPHAHGTSTRRVQSPPEVGALGHDRHCPQSAHVQDGVNRGLAEPVRGARIVDPDVDFRGALVWPDPYPIIGHASMVRRLSGPACKRPQWPRIVMTYAEARPTLMVVGAGALMAGVRSSATAQHLRQVLAWVS
jgi:hypothetical protein